MASVVASSTKDVKVMKIIALLRARWGFCILHLFSFAVLHLVLVSLDIKSSKSGGVKGHNVRNLKQYTLQIHYSNITVHCTRATLYPVSLMVALSLKVSSMLRETLPQEYIRIYSRIYIRKLEYIEVKLWLNKSFDVKMNRLNSKVGHAPTLSPCHAAIPWSCWLLPQWLPRSSAWRKK